MADYPSSTFAPTTKVDNVDTILAADMNAVQNEIIAVENALRTSLAHHLLFVDATYDIGASGATRPRHYYGSGNIVAGGTVSASANYGNSFSGNANGSGTGYSIVDVRNANTTKDANTVALGLGLTGASDMTGAYYLKCYDADGATTGSIAAASGTTVAFNTSSDERLKEQIADFDGAAAWAILDQVRPITFHWTKDGHQDYGFGAQSLQRVYPYAVTGDPEQDLTEIGPMGVDYGKLTPLLTAALKELKARVDALEAQLARLGQ